MVSGENILRREIKWKKTSCSWYHFPDGKIPREHSDIEGNHTYEGREEMQGFLCGGQAGDMEGR